MKMKLSSSSLSLGSKTKSFGCISLILQRFLCPGTSSTYPSDQITETTLGFRDSISEPPRGDESVAVERLMGLDTIPVADKTVVVSRSCSVNSVDYLKRDNIEIQTKHRRVMSSLDSYQFPEYVELEDDKFFILSFEKEKSSMGFGELKKSGIRKCKKRKTRENQTRIEDKENNINAMNVSQGHERLEIEELKQRRMEKHKNRRKRRENKLRKNIEKKRYGMSRDGDLINEEEECGSCNDLSPVSVLDYVRFADGRVTPSPGPGNSSRRQLSSELKTPKCNETIQEDHISLTRRSRESRVGLGSYQEEIWLMICRLTVSDIEGSNWVYGKASELEDVEGIISKDIVSSILDQLIEETIRTLSLTSQV